jgi:hypothetical protein
MSYIHPLSFAMTTYAAHASAMRPMAKYCRLSTGSL